jgi:hypothetical protein
MNKTDGWNFVSGSSLFTRLIPGFENMSWTDNATFDINALVNRHDCVCQSDKTPNRVSAEEFNISGAGIL